MSTPRKRYLKDKGDMLAYRKPEKLEAQARQEMQAEANPTPEPLAVLRQKLRNDQPEHQFQVDCLAYAYSAYPATRCLLFAVPNASKRSKATRGRLLAEGMLAGVPDLALVWAANTYYFELKAPFRPANAVTGKPARYVRKPSRAQLDLHAAWLAQAVRVQVIDSPLKWILALEDILGVLPDTPANRLKRLVFVGLTDAAQTQI